MFYNMHGIVISYLHETRYITLKSNKKEFIKIIEILEKAPRTRKELISAYIDSLGLTRAQVLDKSTNGRANVERSLIGSVIDDMLRKGMIVKSSDGIYTAHDQKPQIIRKEKCESEILRLLSERSMTKNAIRSELMRIFETGKTLTEKDDNKLFSYMGDALRRMVSEGILTLSERRYSLSSKVAAKIDDINGILALKNTFLSRIHKKGGEFFEVYFMTLLEKYVTLYGKKVISNSTTGGSADGGIDGIMQTEDFLGFRETVMVQTKNRTDTTNETTVRGFYGAVCARQGSRGIFVTSSDFHSSAIAFLDSIDNCVGIDGSKIFEMACKTHYGIKKVGAEFVVDEKII